MSEDPDPHRILQLGKFFRSELVLYPVHQPSASMLINIVARHIFRVRISFIRVHLQVRGLSQKFVDNRNLPFFNKK